MLASNKTDEKVLLFTTNLFIEDLDDFESIHPFVCVNISQSGPKSLNLSPVGSCKQRENSDKSHLSPVAS